MSQRILVWDVPTRIFHWTLALSFAGAFLTAETERYRDLHISLGYLMLGLVGFRLLWGFVGSRYARFSSFTFRPAEVVEYLRSLLKRESRHYLGHNPAGAMAIFLLLGLTLLAGVSGVLLHFEIGGEVFEEVHEVFANGMLVVVLVHIAGVIVSSLLHRENLVRSMVTGYKSGEPSEGITRPFVWLGVIMTTVVAAFLTFYQPSGQGSAEGRDTPSLGHGD